MSKMRRINTKRGHSRYTALHRCRDCGTYFYQDETYQDNDGEKCPNCLSQSWEIADDE